jgi:hypothetical protein
MIAQVEPYDHRPYDPLAEAVGWHIRACARVEFWLNFHAPSVLGVEYPDIFRKSVEEKALALASDDPRLGPMVDRILELTEIRNTLAHGIAQYMNDRSVIHLELQPRAKGAPYRKLRLTRAELVSLGDEAREIAGRLQVYSPSTSAAFDDIEDDEEDED